MKKSDLLIHKIHEIVRQKNLTHHYLADIWELSDRTVSSIFSCHRPLNIPEFYIFAEKMNMKEEELIQLKTEDEKVVMHNTFNHQKGNGVLVQNTVPESERAQFLARLADKDAIIVRLDLRIQKMEEEIEFLRAMMLAGTQK